MECLTFIFARAGSKGIPHKNIKPLHGKPLIGWAVEQALNCNFSRDVFISTDSKEIAACAKNFGAKIPFIRPEELAQDFSPEILAWRHAIESIIAQKNKTYTHLIVVPTTAPLRNSEDIDACVAKAQKTNADLVVTCTPSNRHPAFNIIKETSTGEVSIYDQSLGVVNARQETSSTFDLATVAYVAKVDFVLKTDRLFHHDAKIRCVNLPKSRCIDIDDEFDFQVAELLMAKKYGQ